MIQIISVVGSLLILSAYAANQSGRLATAGRPYALLNLFGAGILAVVALLEEQWGFLLLETVWSAVSLWALVRPRADAA
ncbi:MAG TPA: hypothetical protein VM266_01765 [Solirubrobacteraceae bacterium]|nr:hypothetical protein [Solirubrobacteraceae bacterium]